MGLSELWDGLGYPLLRLCLLISVGVLVGNLIEALHWTRGVARVASPLVRVGHLRDVSGASFSMAFFSGVTANTMLAEAYDSGRLTRRELVFSNLFNSLPTYFLHLPTTAFIVIPMIQQAALPYLSLTIGSALFRTLFILCVARVALPPRPDECVRCVLPEQAGMGWRGIVGKTWERFLQRIRKILLYTVPIYIAIYALNRAGFFSLLETATSEHLTFLSWLPPEALGIMVLQITAEFTAGLATAGALLDAGTLTVKEVVLALILGNVLSSPMRAFRHQFPYYAGIFKPRLAMILITYNQSLRVGSLVLLGFVYYVVA
ncbi:MAG: hypothetical protein ACOCVU_01495 [Desulfohalobiaceae bacterium]